MVVKWIVGDIKIDQEKIGSIELRLHEPPYGKGKFINFHHVIRLDLDYLVKLVEKAKAKAMLEWTETQLPISDVRIERKGEKVNIVLSACNQMEKIEVKEITGLLT